MAEAEAWVMIPKLDKKKTGCVLEMKPLVLCKDCRHGEPVKNGAEEDCIQCNNDDLLLDGNVNFPDWFCADGERRDDDA